MKTLMSYRNAVRGLAALALVFSVSCGKKSSGGGSTATPPATNSAGDCSASTSKCSVGQKYSSGIFLGSGSSENYYGYDKSIYLYLGFFAKSSKEVVKQNGYVSYNGDVTANGTIKITKGAYGLLTNPQPARMVSNFSFDFYWDIGFGGGNNYNYPDYGYDYGYDYGNNYGNDYGSCYNNNCGCTSNNCNGNNGYQNNQCELPAGTYKVSTATAGNWYDSYYPQVSNLKLKITGSKYTVSASFNGYVFSNNSSSNQGTLMGTLSFETVNKQTCNVQVVF